jgi:hypothetical protein
MGAARRIPDMAILPAKLASLARKKKTMDGYKIDPDKYRGLSLEEAQRRMEEDERRAINEDPRTVAAFARLDRLAAEEEAERQRLAEEAERQREAEVAAEWEREKESRRRQWLEAGGTESEFEEAWPELRKGILMERMFVSDLVREEEGAASVRGIWNHNP